MRVISRPILVNYWTKHTDAEQALKTWLYEAEHAIWEDFRDIKDRYSSSDPIPGNRCVFNIKGNRYRLLVKIHFNTHIVYIRFVGTHAEYDRINAEKY